MAADDSIKKAILARSGEMTTTVQRFENELETLIGARTAIRETNEKLTEAGNRLKSQDDEIQRLRAELETKTADLRRLQAERDPVKIEARIAAECERANRKVHDELAKANITVAELQSEVTALKAAKRKLRDALERTKGNRA